VANVHAQRDPEPHPYHDAGCYSHVDADAHIHALARPEDAHPDLHPFTRPRDAYPDPHIDGDIDAYANLHSDTNAHIHACTDIDANIYVCTDIDAILYSHAGPYIDANGSAQFHPPPHCNIDRLAYGHAHAISDHRQLRQCSTMSPCLSGLTPLTLGARECEGVPDRLPGRRRPGRLCPATVVAAVLRVPGLTLGASSGSVTRWTRAQSAR
jgi:hypothetical protein